MKYAIVYSSNTGNTRLLANRIRSVLTENKTPEALAGTECIYFGAPDPKALGAGMIFTGFWTDKGTCDAAAGAFLEELRDKRLFLFGTAGFGGSAEYFERILSHVREHISSSNSIEGVYMCQGKMPMSVRRRYEMMPPEEAVRRDGLIRNYDSALPHPDSRDLDRLAAAVRELSV